MANKVGAWVAVYCPTEKLFLFAKRSPASNNPYQWNFFGGSLDRGEKPVKGAARELAEESGLGVRPKDLIELASTKVRGRAFAGMEKELHFFLLLTRSPTIPVLNSEHSEARWFHASALPLSVTRLTRVAYDLGVIEQAIKYAKKHKKKIVDL